MIASFPSGNETLLSSEIRFSVLYAKSGCKLVRWNLALSGSHAQNKANINRGIEENPNNHLQPKFGIRKIASKTLNY